MSLDDVTSIEEEFKQAIRSAEDGDYGEAALRFYLVVCHAVNALLRLNDLEPVECKSRQMDKAVYRLSKIYGDVVLRAFNTAFKMYHMYHLEELPASKEELLDEAWKIEELIDLVRNEVRWATTRNTETRS